MHRSPRGALVSASGDPGSLLSGLGRREREGAGRWQPRSHPARFTTFLAVGFCGLGTQLGVTAVLYGHFHIALWLGAALAIQVAIVVNFTLNSFITWRDRRGTRTRWHRFLNFEGVSLVGLGINEGVLLTAATVVGIHYLVAVLFGAIAASVWNYVANGKFTFPPGVPPSHLDPSIAVLGAYGAGQDDPAKLPVRRARASLVATSHSGASAPGEPCQRSQPSPRDYAFCTIATAARFGYASVLTSDLARHHPGTPIFVLRLGEESAWPEGGLLSRSVTVLSTAEVGITAATLGQLQASQLSDEEYLHALRPWLLRAVLDRGAMVALFVADDVHVLGSLQAVAELAAARGAGFVRRSPMLQPSMAANLSQGTEESAIELDLLAVGGGGAAFLERWRAASLRGGTVPGLSASEFVDRAADEFTDAIIVEPRLNLGWWNFSLFHDASGATSQGVESPSVAALHLHGFDARRPHLITAEGGPHLPLRLSERPWLASLCGCYAQRVLEAGSDAAPSATAEAPKGLPGVGLRPADGSTARIGEDRFVAECWKRARRGADIGRCSAPPDPAVAGHEEWISWLNSPPDWSLPRVSRYLVEVYRSRPDLRIAFPDLASEPEPFLRWARAHGRRELNIPDELLVNPGHATSPMARHSAARPATTPGSAFGVNVVGLLSTHLGLGEAARQLLSALEAARIPYRTEEVILEGGPQLRRADPIRSRGNWFPINIICLNPPELQAFHQRMGPALLDRRYNIGVWVWETETVPTSWREAAGLVDEVWVPSDYVRTAFSQAVALPIFTVPHAVPAPRHPRYMDRSYLGLPDRFTFLFMFDFFSSMWRKNALGLVEAFRRAFSPLEGPRLVIKTLNADRHLGDFEELLLAVAGREDIVVHDRVLTANERAALLDACDCYVSLHRAEGFGLTMAEAMALAKPVIATGYSGNLEYMTPQNSYLVGYRRVPVGVNWDRYPASHIWAQPDLIEAASLLSAVYKDRNAAHDRGEVARADVERVCSPAMVGTLVRERLEEIWSIHRAAGRGRRAQVRRYSSQVIRRIARTLLESRHRS